MSEIQQSRNPSGQFDELPDAPPKRKIRLSWSGKLGITVLVFWAIIVVIGPSISPYHEAEFLDESLFIVPGSDDKYPDTDFQPPAEWFYWEVTIWAGIRYREFFSARGRRLESRLLPQFLLT